MKTELKTFLLSATLIIYAFFSSSTPDNIGIAEIAMGGLLIFFVGLRGVIEPAGGFLFIRKKEVPNYIYFVFQLLFYILTIYGLIFNHNTLDNYVRDIIPFIYLFLPLFFLPNMRAQPDYWLHLLVYLISLVGVSYSIRFFLIDPETVYRIGRTVVFGDLNYFPMDPAVIFTATFLLTIGIHKIVNGSLISGSLHLVGGTIAYMSIIAILARAQIALVLIAILINLFLLFGRRMLFSSLIFMIVVGGVGYFGRDFFADVYGLIMQKFISVGLSSRDLEVMAVIDNGLGSNWTFFFGEGWGGLIANPITGYFQTRFVHNFLAYSFFKGGIIGLLLIVVYVFWFIRIYIESLNLLTIASHMTTGIMLASFNVIIINIIFEGGYKMFSFGLILCALILSHQVSKSTQRIDNRASNLSNGSVNE